MNRIISATTLSLLLLAGCGGNAIIDQDDEIHIETDSASVAQDADVSVKTTGQPAVNVPITTPAAPLAEAAAQRDLSLYSSPMPTVDPLQPLDSRENYADTEISGVFQVIEQPVSTFATDVDTASYTNVRRYLQQGQLPPEGSVRAEEFINYFDYQLASPKSLAEPIGLQTELMITPWNPKTHLLRVSLQAYRSSMDSLPPLNLVFLLDVSGSMNNPDKLPLMQRSFNLLVDQLRAQDHVAIVVYAGASGVVLEPTAGDQRDLIIAAINRLQAGGSTHGSAGIELAYRIAQKHFDEDGINRVILGTDGDFNVGTTSIDALKALIEQKRKSGIFLNVLGFGSGNYNDYLMEELSNHGNGVAYYIDSYQEARKVFADQITATLQTVAKDVKVQIEFNPQQVAEYRLIGYDNRLLKREDFNNDRVDAGDMGSGHSVTALYEITLQDSDYRFVDPLRFGASVNPEGTAHAGELAFVKVRYKAPDSDHSQLMSIPVAINLPAQPTDAMLLSSTVAGFAERLRGSTFTQGQSYQQLITQLQPTLAYDRWGYRQELLQLIRNMASQERL